MSQGSKIVGAVEIGTSKVVALIGEIVGGRSLNIIGLGQCTSRGVKKGEIENFRAASDCTHAAILTAEESAGVKTDSIYLAQSGGSLRGRLNEAQVNVKSSSNRVSRQDLQKVCEECKSKDLPDGRVYVHHIRSGLYLDGRAVADPVGMEGEKIGAAYWSVDGDERAIRDGIRIINGLGCRVEDVILSSVASGAMVADESEKKTGVLVVDIGCGSTDWVQYRNGNILRTGVLPIGGDHLTNDLSAGLRVNMKVAERHKVENGRADINAEDKSEKIWLMGDQQIGDRQVRREGIYQILSLRVEELFTLLKKQVGVSAAPEMLPAGIILTGGTARLPGIAAAASRVFSVEARIGHHPPWARDNLRKLEYSTALGLLHYALSGNQVEIDRLQSDDERSLLRKVANLFSF